MTFTPRLLSRRTLPAALFLGALFTGAALGAEFLPPPTPLAEAPAPAPAPKPAPRAEEPKPAAAPVASDALSSIDARFAAMERRLAELAEQNRSLRQTVAADSATIAQLAARAKAAADAKPPAPVPAVTLAGKETKLALGGLMQILGETGNAPDARYAGIGDRFQLRRLRLSVAGAFAEDMAFKVESDFGNAAVAGNSGARGQLTDAFVMWTKYPALKLEAGQFKTPFGYEQLVADPKTLFVERTVANDRLTVGRQIGTMALGDLFGKKLNYSLGLFNGTGVNNGANDNTKFMTSGRLAATVYDGKRGTQPVRLTVATDFFNTVDKGTFTGRRTGYGADAQLTAGPTETGFEWLRNDSHPVAGLPVTAEGWSAYTAWNIAKQWQAVLRYDDYDSNIALPNTTTREWTWGVNYLLKGDDLKFSLDYLHGQQPAPAPGAGRLIGRVQVVF